MPDLTRTQSLKQPRFTRFEDFEAYLDSLGMFHMDLGLHRMRAALAALGLTHPGFISAQVVGTNGKGSTSTMLAAMLSACGHRTGLYTSPHFVSVRERIQVDNRQLPDACWLDAANAVLDASRQIGPDFALTYFELLTVMAAWMFRHAGCRTAVFEAGLGGAHDATTALEHHLIVFTPMGLDHVAVLGPSLADIARDKAKAMRPRVPAVSAAQRPVARAILTQTARTLGAELFFTGDPHIEPAPDWPTLPGLAGSHQEANLRVAVGALRVLESAYGLPLAATALCQGARQAFLPGRLQRIGPQHPATGTPNAQPEHFTSGTPNAQPVRFILDGAHNQPGLVALAAALRQLNLAPACMVFACLKDKDIDAILPLARELTRGPVFVPPLDAPGRDLDPAWLAERFGPQAKAVPSVERALKDAAACGAPALVCGSLYLLAQAYLLHPGWLGQAPAGSL